jgi:hypothetical protein
MLKPPTPTYFEPKGTLHYNVRTTAGVMVNRLTARELQLLHPENLAWIWIVEKGRHATEQEVRILCRHSTS